MSKSGLAGVLAILIIALAIPFVAPALAQDGAVPVIHIKPCFQCPTGTNNADGSFTCPDDDADGTADWISCGIPTHNMCAKALLPVAILDYADYGISRDNTTIVFEGASPVSCSGADVDHDVPAGGDPDDLVCSFRTQDLKRLRAKALLGLNLVRGCMTITVGETEYRSCDPVVIHKTGLCW